MRSLILAFSILFCSASTAQEKCPSVQSILDLIGTPYEDPSVPEYLKLGTGGDRLADCFYYVNFEVKPDNGHRLFYARFLSKNSPFGEYETYVDDLLLGLKWEDSFEKVHKAVSKSKEYEILEANPVKHEIKAKLVNPNEKGVEGIEVWFTFREDGVLKELTLWKNYLY